MKGMDLLGHRVEDKITNFKGIVTSISYDLYGCIQALVVLKTKDEEKNSYWRDIKALNKLSKKPVMEIPDFSKEEIGCEMKPIK
jgi:hypothetical protein